MTTVKQSAEYLSRLTQPRKRKAAA